MSLELTDIGFSMNFHRRFIEFVIFFFYVQISGHFTNALLVFFLILLFSNFSISLNALSTYTSASSQGHRGPVMNYFLLDSQVRALTLIEDEVRSQLNRDKH